MEASPISQLDADHLERVLEVRPEMAVEMGLSRHLERWGPSGPDAEEHLAHLITVWADARAEFDASGMSPRDVTHLSMDQTVLEGSLRMLGVALDHPGPCQADPDVLAPRVRLLLRQAYQLCANPDGIAAIAARLTSLGASLAQSCAHLTRADAHLLARAKARAPLLKEALKDLTPIALRQVGEDSQGREAMMAMMAATQEVETAIATYRTWLDGLEAVPGLAVFGEQTTEALLDSRRWEMPPDDVEDLCRVHIEQMRLEMRRLRQRAFKRQSLIEALDMGRGQTPFSSEEAAVWLQELGVQARQFCLETAIFPVADDAVVVEDASPALTPLLGALGVLPAVHEREGPVMILIPDSKDETVLKRLSVADLEAICARHLFPGACLYSSLAVRSASWVRQGLALGLSHSVAGSYGSDMRLGWQLYAQELMRELQFRESPAARLILCERSLIDGVLGWFDMKLHRGHASFDEVVAGLVEHTSLGQDDAVWHACQLLEAPGRAAAAIVGKTRIGQLRRTARIQWRHGYTDRRFHDFVLHAGALPVAVLFNLLDEFSPFNADEGTVEYDINERPDAYSDDQQEPRDVAADSSSPADAAPDAIGATVPGEPES